MGVALPRKENGPTVVSTKAFLILVDLSLLLFSVNYDCEQYVKRTMSAASVKFIEKPSTSIIESMRMVPKHDPRRACCMFEGFIQPSYDEGLSSNPPPAAFHFTRVCLQLSRVNRLMSQKFLLNQAAQ